MVSNKTPVSGGEPGGGGSIRVATRYTADSQGAEQAAPQTAGSATPTPKDNQDVQIQAKGGTVKRAGDRVFETLSTVSAATITVIIAAIGLFLLWRAIPALMRNAEGITGFFTYAGDWNTADTEAMYFGIPNLFFSTVLISLVALALAMPVALGVAIFLSNYAPKKLVKPLGFLVDLLAAVPSIVYGLWGVTVLGPTIGPLYEWIADSFLGNIFLFQVYDNSPSFATSRNMLTGGIVLAIMILPVIAATAREVFVQTPKGHVEAALALGATRWEVVKMTVIPFGLSGYVSGAMLGLGRALGETMALYLVVSPSSAFRGSLFDGGTTFATAIANAAPEFNDDIKAGAYIAAGLVLFLLTFVVNAAARAIVNKKK
ncbi:MAG: phosphate ABC transporter permease subunit PstC [Corynebacterium glucuronolyticum]|nr:phosphate ABC transporter permease subunit PstC [Corynebacterium glucuronolyticum]MDD7587604.1 phosphate ABC transporter permease subunit PstC [Mycobacteriaceae bacterium]MDY5835170.1 phosphate ABC transporter permease subunit PstC [Corynebacterium glucuronolyticum]